jgi:hypothetical protein
MLSLMETALLALWHLARQGEAAAQSTAAVSAAAAERKAQLRARMKQHYQQRRRKRSFPWQHGENERPVLRAQIAKALVLAVYLLQWRALVCYYSMSPSYWLDHYLLDCFRCCSNLKQKEMARLLRHLCALQPLAGPRHWLLLPLAPPPLLR